MRKSRKQTEETKKKISEALKGRNTWTRGRKHTDETKKKIGEVWRNRKHTEESKRKMSEAHKGKKLSEETKRKVSKNNSRYWLGKKRLPYSEEWKRKLKESKIGNKNCLGNKLSDEHKRKISEANKGRCSPTKGKKLSEGHRRKISEANKGNKNPMWNKKGKLSPNWRGGISFEPYGLEWNKDLREVIRNRDRRKCQVCEKTELENGKKLDVHHIDYNKQNNDPKNLISLCNNCHMKTNQNREYWTNYFKGLI